MLCVACGVKKHVTIPKLQLSAYPCLIWHVFYLFPSILPGLINLPNEVQCRGLVQGISLGTCLTEEPGVNKIIFII